MTKIISNKPLKYDPIHPALEAIIELEILDVRDFTQSQLSVVTIQDSIIVEEGQRRQLNIRQKELTFAELDQLELAITSNPEIVIEGSYMEKRIQLLQLGLLYITKNDPSPIYFSTSEDWELVIPPVDPEPETPEEPI